MPLFTGGLNRSRVAQALEQANAAQINVEAQRREVLQSVSAAYAQVLSARAGVAAGEEAVRAASVAAEGVRQEAQVGLRTTLDVLNQEVTLRASQTGLATARAAEYVARASLLAAALMQPLLSGVFTVADDTLFAHLVQVLDALKERIEPSAAAGFSGPGMLVGTTAGQAWLRSTGVDAVLRQATQLVWTTGGLLVPDAQYQGFVQRGRAVLAGRGSLPF